jgi:hypothetical protein
MPLLYSWKTDIPFTLFAAKECLVKFCVGSTPVTAVTARKPL